MCVYGDMNEYYFSLNEKKSKFVIIGRHHHRTTTVDNIYVIKFNVEKNTIQYTVQIQQQGRQLN